MAVQTWTDKRFRRAHVKPARRRRAATARRRAAGGIAVLGGLGVGALLLPGALSTAPFLVVDTISIQGNDRISHGEVLALIGPLRGQNMLVADLEAYRQRLMTSGWVKTATLRRVLPATIEVSVEERKAVGLARFGGYLYLIDQEGAVIDEYGPRFADVDLPIIDGLSRGTQVEVDERRSRLAANLIRELDAEPDLASRVSQINVGDPHDAVVLLNDSPTLIHLGDERFVERLREYEFLAPTLRAHEPDIDYADMRFEQKVFIRAADPGKAIAPRMTSSRAGEVTLQ